MTTYLFGFFTLCMILKGVDINTTFTIYNIVIGVVIGLILAGKLTKNYR